MLGDSHSLIDPGLLPDREHLTPLYRQRRLTVPPASIEEHYSDWTRLTRELNRGNGGLPVASELAVLRQLAEAVRAANGDSHGRRRRVRVRACGFARCKPATSPHIALGLAVDIGTTTVAAQLVDLDDGSLLATADFLQPADPPRRRRHQPHRLRPQSGAPGRTSRPGAGNHQRPDRAAGRDRLPSSRATFAPPFWPATPP